MSDSMNIVLGATTVSFVNKWYTTGKADFSIPLAGSLFGIFCSGVEAVNHTAGVGLSVLMGISVALKAPAGGTAPFDTISNWIKTPNSNVNALFVQTPAPVSGQTSNAGYVMLPKALNGGGTNVLGTTVGSYVGASALSAAETKLGQPYRLGAPIGSGSWDCGSLVSWAYASAGVTGINRFVPTMYGQLLGSPHWKRVSGGISKAGPGDIVIPYPTLSHVVMAVGDGHTVIEAPHKNANVRTMDYNADGYPFAFAVFTYIG